MWTGLRGIPGPLVPLVFVAGKLDQDGLRLIRKINSAARAIARALRDMRSLRKVPVLDGLVEAHGAGGDLGGVGLVRVEVHVIR